MPADRAQAPELRNLAHAASVGIDAAFRAWGLCEEAFPAVSLYSEPPGQATHPACWSA